MDMKEKLQEILEQNPFAHLGDALYTVLYQGIIRMEISADDVLSETALARELELSRTPVRNALMRLQDEGLLLRKGASFCVAPLLKDECRALMETRLALEGQAAFLAAVRITPKQQDDLKELMKRYAAACCEWETEKIVEYDHSFHQAVVDASDNPILADIYRQLSPRVLHYRHYMFSRAGKNELKPVLKNSVRLHQSVFNAIQSGYGDIAQKQLERDVAGMMDVIGGW